MEPAPLQKDLAKAGLRSNGECRNSVRDGRHGDIGMTPDDNDAPQGPDHLSETPHLASALASDQFKQFLDHMPFAVAVSQLDPKETITYANIVFERVTGQAAGAIVGQSWHILPGTAMQTGSDRPLREAVVEGEDYLGVFRIERDSQAISVDAWSNVILNEASTPTYRLVALADIGDRAPTDQEKLEQQLAAKDILLRELQHRVKNNLQMITALIRLEARNLRGNPAKEPFDRLAGRIESLSLLYRSMAESPVDDSIDLGVYLSEIASSVMRAHAVEGIRLDLKVDTWPVSINVAMPTGLVVNELLTNSLKHAFTGREGGTIKLHSLVDDKGCRVIVADDGVGLRPDAVWPVPGKMTALIVQSLRQNAGAELEIRSTPESGMQTTIKFSRADAAPGST